MSQEMRDEYVDLARQLYAGRDFMTKRHEVVKKIQRANTENEIFRILHDARQD